MTGWNFCTWKIKRKRGRERERERERHRNDGERKAWKNQDISNSCKVCDYVMTWLYQKLLSMSLTNNKH